MKQDSDPRCEEAAVVHVNRPLRKTEMIETTKKDEGEERDEKEEVQDQSIPI